MRRPQFSLKALLAAILAVSVFLGAFFSALNARKKNQKEGLLLLPWEARGAKR